MRDRRKINLSDILDHQYLMQLQEPMDIFYTENQQRLALNKQLSKRGMEKEWTYLVK